MIKPPPDKIIKPTPDRTIINIDAQKQLAKLLATEDIQVTVGNFKTAYFDVKNRILGLPAWNTDTKAVSDLLVGHEVGHALFTPEDAIAKFKERFPDVPFDVANIVEDIRIERMIQLKYPGLIKSFNDGYEYFKETDIFKIKDKVVNNLGFLDRLNLKGKLRTLIDIEFTNEEQALFDKVYACQTYENVLDVIEELTDYISNQEEDEKERIPENSDETGDEAGGEGNASDEEDDNESEDANDSNKTQGESDDPTEDASPGNSEYDEPVSKEYFISETQEAMDRHLEDLGEMATNETILNPIEEKNIPNIIYSIDEVRAARKSSPHYDTMMNNDEIHQAWLLFKNETKKNVMTLCKEFERRKAAHQYQRSNESRTGTINVNKLHSYKYDDQIFKSVTNLADAKNHGMNIFIDNSGSMGECITDVIKQTIQLIMFCKTVDIPFTVYSFTSKTGRYDTVNKALKSDYASKGEFYRDNFMYGINLDLFDTQVVELMNSSLKKIAYETALKELYIQSGSISISNPEIKFEVPCVYAGRHYTTCKYVSHNCLESSIEDMGGTPLLETLIIANTLIKNFRKKHRVEKMITVFLTDGDGQTPGSHFTRPLSEEEGTDDKKPKLFERMDFDPWSNHRYIKIGKYTVDISRQNPAAYSDLVNIIKKENNTKMIGFFLTNNVKYGKSHAFQALAHKRGSHYSYIDKCKETAKKEKSNCYSIDDGFKYDTYFIIDNLKKLRLNDDEEFMIPDTVNTEDLNNASNRNKLATSFKKFNTTKRQSRIFLNKFIDTIV